MRVGIVLGAGSVQAEDAWVVQFGAFGGYVYPPCGGIIWYDDLVFHNATDAPLSVQALETSNGGSTNSVPLVIPPHVTRSGYGSLNSEISSWAPDRRTQLWAVHLDVPRGVTVSSRALALIRTPNPEYCGPDPGPTTLFAGPALPIVRQLVPAGVPQILLSADLGESEKFGGRRTNVGIYNAGTSTASAFVELRRGCDDRLLDRRLISVPAKTIIQVAGPSFSPDTVPGCTALNTTASVNYAVINADQPTFSYIAVLANQLPPTTPFTFSFVR